MVRGNEQRKLLFEFDSIVQKLGGGGGAQHDEALRLAGIYHNLLRFWAETDLRQDVIVRVSIADVRPRHHEGEMHHVVIELVGEVVDIELQIHLVGDGVFGHGVEGDVAGRLLDRRAGLGIA